MADAPELQAARRLVGQLYEGLERLQSGSRTTRDGLERFAGALRTIADGGGDAADVVDAAIEQLHLDHEQMGAMRELVRDYGLAPDGEGAT